MSRQAFTHTHTNTHIILYVGRQKHPPTHDTVDTKQIHTHKLTATWYISIGRRKKHTNSIQTSSQGCSHSIPDVLNCGNTKVCICLHRFNSHTYTHLLTGSHRCRLYTNNYTNTQTHLKYNTTNYQQNHV